MKKFYIWLFKTPVTRNLIKNWLIKTELKLQNRIIEDRSHIESTREILHLLDAIDAGEFVFDEDYK